MTLTFTILGCGSSGGVPRLGSGWGACDPKNPKNRRRRCSLLVERIAGDDRTTVLVDTSPDIRDQLLDAEVTSLDGVVFTHSHADHTHGIDDLRSLAIHLRRKIDVYLDVPTSQAVRERFDYCFVQPAGSSYPPILNEHRLTPGEPASIKGAAGPIIAVPFLQDHGDIVSLGFRFGDVAYSSDLRDLPAASHATLEGLDLWIIDALRYRSHPTHFSVDDALRWIDRFKPKRAILTNMHLDLDYEELRAKLPENVVPAYDGLKVTSG
jgi:phosphoribosyl 1,2-cyclic phosphate phosphodiesterase